MICKKYFLYSLLLFSFACAKLVNIKKVNPSIVLDIRYATTNNFTKTKLYPSATCYLQQPVAQALDKIQKELEQKGLGLKIWDGYRPHSVQYKLWDIVPDPRYVGKPEKGSRHNSGCAVDLTIINRSDGTELDMGTEFDNFTKKAWRSYRDLSKKILGNRKFLEAIMKKHRFVGLPTEWWHFDWKDWQNYPILNIQFSELE